MAGIGEASAIVGVAQLGFSLAKTLNTLVGDYKDARQTLTRMGAEIESTSLAMERLGDLAKKGRLYGSKGVLEAAGLASRYTDAIVEIRLMLKKKNKPIDPNLVSSDEIELTHFEKFRFAFLRPRLEISQLEVSRIKADLTLTYLSLIALTGDTDAEKQQALSEIPSWTRTLKWANLEFEKAVNQQRNSNVTPQSLTGFQSHQPLYSVPPYGPGARQSRPRQSRVIQDDVSAEHLKQYISWAENKHAEAQRKAEELRLQALQLEKMKRQEEEAAKEKVIAEKAIKQYEERKRLEAAELAYKQEKMDHDLRRRLQDANVPEEEINRIMSKAPLMLTGPEKEVGAEVPHTNGRARDRIALLSPAGSGHDNVLPQHQQTQIVHSHSHRYSQLLPLPLRPKPMEKSKKPVERPLLEAWCVDQGSQSRFCTPLAEDWLDEFVASKTYKKSSQRMWQRYAQLHLWYRKQINDIFEEKQRDRRHKWSMISLHQSKPARSPFDLWRPNKDSLVQLILVRMPHHRDQKYKTWLDEGEDGGSFLSILPSAPLPGPNDTHRPASVRLLKIDSLRGGDNESQGTTPSTSGQDDGDGTNPARQNQYPNQATIVVEVFHLDSGYSTILPIDKVDASSLLEGGYDYIETGTDYVIRQQLDGEELDSLIDPKDQSIAVVIYDQDFQLMQAAERSMARNYIKQQTFPSNNLIRGRLVYFRFVKANEMGINGLAGNFVREPLSEIENDPYTRAHHLPSRLNILPGRDASLSRSKRTRFADEDVEANFYEHRLRGRNGAFNNYQPVPIPTDLEHPPRPIPAAYAPPPRREPPVINLSTRARPGTDHYSSFDDYPTGKAWTVAPRPGLVRQNSHQIKGRRIVEPAFLTSGYGKEERSGRHRADSPPSPPLIPRRSDYEIDVGRRSRHRDAYRSEIDDPSAHIEIRSRSRPEYDYPRYQDPVAHYPDAGVSHRRSRYGDRQDSFSDDSYGPYYPVPIPIRRERSRSPPLGHVHYGDASRNSRSYPRGQRSPSPTRRDEEYIASRPPRPYGFTEASLEDFGDPEPNLQSDLDITAMQLAKYTGRMSSNLNPAVKFTPTEPTNDQRRKSSTPQHETGPFRTRSTYVEDTIDDDDIENRPIGDRIFEIHDEPEPIFIDDDEDARYQYTGEPPKTSEASGWNFGQDDKDKNRNNGTTAATNEGVEAHSQWAWPTRAEANDTDWGFGTGKNKGKKKKKKKDTSSSKVKWDDLNEATPGESAAGPNDAATAEGSLKEISKSEKDTPVEEAEKEKEEPYERATESSIERVVPRRRRSSTDDEQNWSWGSHQKDHYDDWEKRRDLKDTDNTSE